MPNSIIFSGMRLRCRHCLQRFVHRRILIFLCSLILIAVLGLRFWEKLEITLQSVHPEAECITENEEKAALRNIFQAWDKILRKYNVSYWIEMGSLLGSYRFQDVIPWDHDGDLAFFWRDTEIIKTKVAPELGKWKIFLDSNNPVQLSMKIPGAAKDILVDVFAFGTYRELSLRLPQGKTPQTLTRATYRNSAFFEESFCDTELEDILPLQSCQIGNLSLSCPNNIQKVLQRRYPYTFWMGFNVPFKIRCYANPVKLAQILFSSKSFMQKG